MQLLGVTLAVFAALACSPCFGQTGAVRKAATELIEVLAERGGRAGAKELAEFGGHEAVKGVLEKAAREGGEALVERVARYGQSHGLAALRFIERSPAKVVGALDELGPELAAPAIRAAAREPQLVARLVETYGASALRVAAGHPGVGTRIAEQLGQEGIELAGRLPTEQAVSLARWGDDVAGLPAAERGRVLAAIRTSPEKALNWLDRHPKVLLTAGGVAAFIAAKDNLFPPEGIQGPVERMTREAVEAVAPPIQTALYAAGGVLIAALGLYLAMRLVFAYRRAAAKARAGK